MEMQEILDKVVNHLFTQKKRSGHITQNNFLGIYHDQETGCKCAIGCLIPDDKYVPSIEEKIWNAEKCRPILISLDIYNGTDITRANFLSDLQYLHDSNLLNFLQEKELLDVWNKEFIILAARYNLKYVDQITA